MAASDTVTDRPLPVLNEVLTWPAPAPAPPAPALEVEPPLLSFAESVDCARDMAASDTVTDRPLPVLNEVLTWPAPALEVEPPLLSFAESVDCARDMAASDTVTDRPLPVLN